MKLTKLQHLAEEASSPTKEGLLRAKKRLEKILDLVEDAGQMLDSPGLEAAMKMAGFPATETKAARDLVAKLDREVSDLQMAISLAL